MYHDENILKQKAIEKEAKKIARDKAREEKKQLKALEKEKRNFKVGEIVMFHCDITNEDKVGEITKINMRNATIEDEYKCMFKVSRKDIINKL